MAKRKENLIAVISWLIQVAGIMADVLGAKETENISLEIRSLTMRMRIGRSDILQKRYVNIPDHTFLTLIDLISIMASYIPDVAPYLRESIDNCLRDIIKEVDYEWKDQKHD